MEYKFLFGTNHLTKTGEEDSKETRKVGDYILLSPRNDLLQHSDMKNRCSFLPTTGGFCRRLHAGENSQWYGESISCRVKTSESMLKSYHDLLIVGNFWMFEFESYQAKFNIFAMCPSGFQPSDVISGIDWKECNLSDIRAG